MDRYRHMHSQLLYDLERFYVERIKHYEHLDIVAKCWRHELVKLTEELERRKAVVR